MRGRRRNAPRTQAAAPTEPPTLFRVLLRRLWLIALIAALAGTAGWWLVKGDPKVYERTISFVIRPSTAIPPQNVPDAVRGLSDDGGQLVNTIAEGLASPQMLERAAQRAGADIGPSYAQEAAIRPGSNVIEVALQGPDPDVLADIGSSYERAAVSWVGEAYNDAYELEILGAEASLGPIAPNVTQTIILAVLLGGLVAFGATFVEARARRVRASAAPTPATGSGEEPRVLLSVDDLTGRIDRLEAILQSQLRDGEKVVRVGPRRLGIVTDPTAAPAPAPAPAAAPARAPRRQSR